MNHTFLITGISRVVLVGKEEYKAPRFSFSGPLPANELIFHFSGDATVHFNGKRLKTEKDTIRFLPKGAFSEYVVDSAKSGECILICFDTDHPVAEEAFVMRCQKSDAVGALFKKLFSVWVGRGEGYYFECISLLYKIFAELQKQNYMPENQYRVLKPVLDYISTHFLDRKIYADDLAACSGVSYSYIKRLFAKKFGMSPTQYMIGMKINYARDLLQMGTYSVTQVAERCGYADVYYFSRQFKEHVGISPTVFIEKYKSSK